MGIANLALLDRGDAPTLMTNDGSSSRRNGVEDVEAQLVPIFGGGAESRRSRPFDGLV